MAEGHRGHLSISSDTMVGAQSHSGQCDVKKCAGELQRRFPPKYQVKDTSRHSSSLAIALTMQT